MKYYRIYTLMTYPSVQHYNFVGPVLTHKEPKGTPYFRDRHPCAGVFSFACGAHNRF